jgi:hypothetical protein
MLEYEIYARKMISAKHWIHIDKDLTNDVGAKAG